MSDDWDVIEELEFWDDYKEIYGEDPLSGKQQKRLNKAKKQNAKMQKNQATGCCAGTMVFMISVVLLVVVLIVCGTTFIVSAKNLKPTDKGWTLQWSDEFNGKKLNEKNWTYDIGTGNWGWGNGELEAYTKREKNVKLRKGKLVISAIKENYPFAQYTSGRLKTMDKKYFKYGKIEARIKVERGNQDGVWPAFWMMGNDGRPWPECGELDVMEHANDREYASGAIHWMANGNNMMWSGMFNGHVYEYPGGMKKGINKWHTYGIVWGANHIDWYVDNNIYFSADILDSNSDAFRKDQYFLLNLAIASESTGYSGFTGPKKNFKNATMYVDYVRVYQNKDKSYTIPEKQKMVVSDRLDTTGVQINKKDNAVRIRSFVEPDIGKRTISTYGVIIGIKTFDGKDDSAITEKDLAVDNDGGFIKVFQNESQDYSFVNLQKSDTATYYNTDMIFDDGLKKHIKAQYYVRPYAIMENGAYVYGKVKVIDMLTLMKA